MTGWTGEKKFCTAIIKELCPYFDAVVLTYGDSHGHGDWTDAPKDIQQGKTETLTELFSGSTGETGTAPEGKAAFNTGENTYTHAHASTHAHGHTHTINNTMYQACLFANVKTGQKNIVISSVFEFKDQVA